MNNKISHDLINSGFDFLEKSISEFRDEPKHSTVNFCIGVELLLKSRLVYEHWSLIIKDKHPDLQKFKEGEFQSLNFKDLIPRIEGVTSQVFDDKAKDYFKKLAEHRNKIIHFIHTAHTGDNSSDNFKKQQEIAEQQINGWLQLKKLLLEYWQEIFAEDYSDRIKEISRCMAKEAKHLKETRDLNPTRLNNLAMYYYEQAQYDEAEPLYLQALEIRKQTLGESHPDYATSLNNLAVLYEAQGLYEQAEPLYLQALEIRKQTLGESHPSYATSLNNLAGLYEVQGLYERAEPLYLQAIKILEAILGADHPNTQTVKENYEDFKQSH